MDMSGHDMGSTGSTEEACKINMMFNWYTIDACFLSEQWHVRSVGAYVGSVIGVFLLVVALEAFRRVGRDYDRTIRRNYYAKEKQVVAALAKNNDSVFEVRPFRPSFGQHFVRSFFYFIQFSVSCRFKLPFSLRSRDKADRSPPFADILSTFLLRLSLARSESRFSPLTHRFLQC
ncbi:Ctr copper transporter family-domain-containing protein [Leucosporidium creatinivorum]|uniref:Copper transport protein n=1 Tax=Leucosporidium creatinivorum TaxID=106004 RepID=A0A1Y2DJN8_9BASI|nr:Ctr copper transporter family-domain-containing protein [Leucosporidium creatinivorum]